MGCWGTTVFENDVSADWAPMFRENPGVEFLRETFDDIDEDPDFVNEVVACFVLAAAEVVAAAGGQPGTTPWAEYAGAPEQTGPPAFIRAWIEESGFRPDAELVRRARHCVGRVLENSELKDDWQGSENFAAWQADVEGLAARLDRIIG